MHSKATYDTCPACNGDQAFVSENSGDLTKTAMCIDCGLVELAGRRLQTSLEEVNHDRALDGYDALTELPDISEYTAGGIEHTLDPTDLSSPE